MQNQYSKNSCQFSYWTSFNSRELTSKDNLFFHNDGGVKYTITLILLFIVAIIFILIQ